MGISQNVAQEQAQDIYRLLTMRNFHNESYVGFYSISSPMSIGYLDMYFIIKRI